MSDDFGPIPISRLKQESPGIFDALDAGRRVLVSRSGRVVAAIEPASVERHALSLATFALPHAAEVVHELSATSIGQGSPSRAVHAAEAGQPSLVTRNNKVFGVMTAPAAPPTLESVEASERVLADFERAHPDATPAEFAALAAHLDDSSRTSIAELPLASTGSKKVLLDALLTRASTLISIHSRANAEETLHEVIRRFDDDPSEESQQAVARSMVTLAKLYVDEDRPADALDLLDRAVARLEGI
jgi:antitoxin (DNA-binding transcriptional repressor) of toxin-antitoxin stability system